MERWFHIALAHGQHSASRKNKTSKQRVGGFIPENSTIQLEKVGEKDRRPRARMPALLQNTVDTGIPGEGEQRVRFLRDYKVKMTNILCSCRYTDGDS